MKRRTYGQAVIEELAAKRRLTVKLGRQDFNAMIQEWERWEPTN